METKTSALTMLAGQITIVSAYQQMARGINKVKKSQEPLQGPQIVERCLRQWTLDFGPIEGKWHVKLLNFQGLQSSDAFFSIATCISQGPEDAGRTYEFLIGNTLPNVNVVLELFPATCCAVWRYYDAFNKKTLPCALQVVADLLSEKSIRTLNIGYVVHRISVPNLKTFFRKCNLEITLDQIPV